MAEQDPNTVQPSSEQVLNSLLIPASGDTEHPVNPVGHEDNPSDPNLATGSQPEGTDPDDGSGDGHPTSERYGEKAYKKLFADFTKNQQRLKELESEKTQVKPVPVVPEMTPEEASDKLYKDPITMIDARAKQISREMLNDYLRDQQELVAFTSAHPDYKDMESDVAEKFLTLKGKGMSTREAIEEAYYFVKGKKGVEIKKTTDDAVAANKEKELKKTHFESGRFMANQKTDGSDSNLNPILQGMVQKGQSSKRQIFR